MIFSKLVATTFVACATIVGVAEAQATGALGDAAAINDNPVGAAYVATFKPNGKSTIAGTVVAQTAPDGKGVNFAVSVSGLPAGLGPFPYHIHVDPVPADGNCTSTLAHLDPYIRGEVEPCDASKPETCQVGDLSGKHGKLDGEVFAASYLEPYASLKEGIGAFFGNRSLVIHFPNKTRITCANFVKIGTECGAGGPGPVSLPSSLPVSKPPTPVTTGPGPMTNDTTISAPSQIPTSASAITTKSVSISTPTTPSPALFTGAAPAATVNAFGVAVVAAFVMAGFA